MFDIIIVCIRLCMTDWSDYHSGQKVDALAKLEALRQHVRVGGSIPITVLRLDLSTQHWDGLPVKSRQEKVTC